MPVPVGWVVEQLLLGGGVVGGGVGGGGGDGGGTEQPLNCTDLPADAAASLIVAAQPAITPVSVSLVAVKVAALVVTKRYEPATANSTKHIALNSCLRVGLNDLVVIIIVPVLMVIISAFVDFLKL
jgi:hypothetical protein